MDKKKKNAFTLVIVLIMIVAAVVVVISVKGLPDGISEVFDGNYDERKAERQELQKTILGEWQAADDTGFIVDVWRDGEGLFHAIVNISEADGSVIFWEMSGSWQDSRQGFSYSDCKKTHVSYDGDGNPTSSVDYEGGSGSIYAGSEAEGIVWTDDQEKTGDSVSFIYIGEY